MVDGRKVTFQECLLMKSTIKMDITALIDGVFIEFSDNYYITIKDFNTFTAVAKSHEDILYSLQHEAEVKFHHGDYWKAMKRIFAYLKSKGGHVRLVKLLVKYFNSVTGLLSKNRSELDIIALIITNKFRKPKREDVVRNLQIVRHDLAKIHGFKLNDIEKRIDEICKLPLPKMSKPLESVIADVKAIVNADAKLFLDKHQEIVRHILDSDKLGAGISGGSQSSGYIQRFLAEKAGRPDTRKIPRPKLVGDFDIRKIKEPSTWLQEAHAPKQQVPLYPELDEALKLVKEQADIVRVVKKKDQRKEALKLSKIIDKAKVLADTRPKQEYFNEQFKIVMGQ
jgi:hypothetical protein